MRWYPLLTLVIISLLFSMAEPVLAQMGGPGKQMGGHGRAFDMMQQGIGMREGKGMQGLGFMHSSGNAFGNYVTFSIDSQTGEVLDYGIAGVTLFNFSIKDFNYRSTTEQGSVTRISNTDNSVLVKIHDNPAAVINILTNKEIIITFSLSKSVTTVVENNIVRIESGNVVGYILGTDMVTPVVNEMQVTITAPGNSAVIFRASPVNMPMFDHLYQRFSKEIGRNRVGMEVALGRNGTFDVINYSTGMHLNVREMVHDRISLRINATGPAGPILAFNLDNTSLMIREHDRLRIHYDGTPLDCVNDPNMIFNGTDRPLCWVSPIQDRARAQVMVYVPEYSERTIDIVVEPGVLPAAVTMTTMVPAATPETTGFGLLVSVSGLLSAAFTVRKRRN